MKVYIFNILKQLLKLVGLAIIRVRKSDSSSQLSVKIETKLTSKQPQRTSLKYIKDITFLDNYRYSVKKSWMAIPGLRNLSHLDKNNRLSSSEKRQLNDFIGLNTITTSIDDINQFCLPLISKHLDLFEDKTGKLGTENFPQISIPNLEMSINTYKRVAIQKFLEINYPINSLSGLKILDVGCGQGISTLAFSRMGHETSGLDNYYGNSAVAEARMAIKSRIKADFSKASFVDADITSCPEIQHQQYDVVTSISCLEHIDNIDAAFHEMHRIMKTGGVMLHSYNHFWAENGGHAFGILDSPWQHARLNKKDFDEYKAEFHPYEVPLSKTWTDSALNRSITINSIQRSLSAAGFKIVFWKETYGNKSTSENFSSDILGSVQKIYPDVTLADLLATDITFAAIK